MSQGDAWNSIGENWLGNGEIVEDLRSRHGVKQSTRVIRDDGLIRGQNCYGIARGVAARSDGKEDEEWSLSKARRSQLIKQVFDEAQQRDGHDRVEKWYHHPWNHHL